MNYPNPEKPHTKKILKMIEETWDENRIRAGKYVITDCGHYYRKMFNDGGGHKTDLFFENGDYYLAGIDVMHGNLNDVAALGMRVDEVVVFNGLKIEDDKILEIVRGIKDCCKQNKFAYTGGETSFKEISTDINIVPTILATVDKKDFIGIRNGKSIWYPIGEGNELIGIRSSGIHANGNTLIQKLFKDDMFEYKDEILTLTENYLPCLEAIPKDLKSHIHGMTNISGSTFRSLRDLNDKVDYIISWDNWLEPQPIFKETYKRLGRDPGIMYKVFNCSAGFVMAVGNGWSERILKIISEYFDCGVIGRVVKGNGKVMIKDQFGTGKSIVL